MCLTSAAMGGARRDVREAGMRLDWVTGLNDPQSKLTQEIPYFTKIPCFRKSLSGAICMQDIQEEATLSLN